MYQRLTFRKTSATFLAAATMLAAALPFQAASAEEKPKHEKASFPSGLDHSKWDMLLKKYVDEEGLVDYAGWKANAADVGTLDSYLATYGTETETPASGDELGAATANAYNAFIIREVLKKYPIESIMSEKGPFGAKIHNVGGKKISLDDIEKGNSIPTIGWKAHGIFVCVARSCPPLQREAYTKDKLQEQVDTAYMKWLARTDLNLFLPDENEAKLSMIFKWYKADFDKDGGVAKVISQYVPEAYKELLAKDDLKIDHFTYNWGLNDQGEHGRNYGAGSKLIDGALKLFK